MCWVRETLLLTVPHLPSGVGQRRCLLSSGKASPTSGLSLKRSAHLQCASLYLCIPQYISAHLQCALVCLCTPSVCFNVLQYVSAYLQCASVYLSISLHIFIHTSVYLLYTTVYFVDRWNWLVRRCVSSCHSSLRGRSF